MRISVIPTINGESSVIRLLNTSQGLRAISEIGLGRRDQELFVDLLHRNNGVLLVTGPTGSGKTTTLYAALQEVKKQDVNIITVEDPVEYHIDDIEQIQVHSAINFTFARALRNILRHDPDVIMVGEVRDVETAKIAVESALTGHLVLTTLHTNSAASAITRLMEMGIEPYLLSSSILGVLAQRLVRHNCSYCLTEENVEPTIRTFLGVGEDEVFHRGEGCEHCNNTGYSGRFAVYELLVMTERLRSMITPSISVDSIQQTAIVDGMVPLTDNALTQARQGRTSLAEVYRVRLE
jgi:type IV pilus assembly protein PilB